MERLTPDDNPLASPQGGPPTLNNVVVVSRPPLSSSAVATGTQTVHSTFNNVNTYVFVAAAVVAPSPLDAALPVGDEQRGRLTVCGRL